MTKEQFFKDFETEFDSSGDKPFSDKLMFELACLIHEDQFSPEETFKFCKDIQATVNSVVKMNAENQKEAIKVIKKLVTNQK